MTPRLTAETFCFIAPAAAQGALRRGAVCRDIGCDRLRFQPNEKCPRLNVHMTQNATRVTPNRIHDTYDIGVIAAHRFGCSIRSRIYIATATTREPERETRLSTLQQCVQSASYVQHVQVHLLCICRGFAHALLGTGTLARRVACRGDRFRTYIQIRRMCTASAIALLCYGGGVRCRVVDGTFLPCYLAAALAQQTRAPRRIERN